MKRIVKQVGFEWPEQRPVDAPSEVALDPAITDAIIGWMARALIAVVSLAGEVANER